MDKERMKEALVEEGFAERLLSLETPEEVQAAFKEKGVEMRVEEVLLFRDMLVEMVEKTVQRGGELSLEDLDEVSGGNIMALGEPFVAAALREVIAFGLPKIASVLVPAAVSAAAVSAVSAIFRRW